MEKWLIITIAVVFVVFAGLFYAGRSHTAAGAINGIQCSTMEGSAFHIHSNLAIIDNSDKVTVPAGIGIIPNSCLYWLHSHDDTGIIHIEAPEIRTFNLGDFLSIWKGTQGNSYPLEGKNIDSVYVNGQKYDGDYKQIVLENKQDIVLVIGSYNGTIPSFKWPATY